MAVQKKPLLKVPRLIRSTAGRLVFCSLFILVAALKVPEQKWFLATGIVFVILTVFMWFRLKRKYTGWPRYEGWPHLEVDTETGVTWEVDPSGRRTTLVDQPGEVNTYR